MKEIFNIFKPILTLLLKIGTLVLSIVLIGLGGGDMGTGNRKNRKYGKYDYSTRRRR